MNHTPEPSNQELPAEPKQVCTWCVSDHVANIACRCTEPCGIPRCPATSFEEDAWTPPPVPRFRW